MASTRSKGTDASRTGTSGKGASPKSPRRSAPQPASRPSSVVVAGQVRVSVLTDRLVRIEHATDGHFEDRATLAVVNRRFPSVPFDVTHDDNSLTVDTGEVRVVCADVTRPFTSRTLSARIGRGRAAVTWRYGQRPKANLGGTRRTLDGWRGREREKIIGVDEAMGRLRTDGWHTQHLDPGLLSRDGWVVLDESDAVVLDPRADTADVGTDAWPVPRPEGRRHDLYLFAHGADHKGALADAAELLGSQPLPPRFAFGYWFSRYWAYTDRELESVADRFDEMGLPLDVLVIDMDWHLPGWTGYTWDRRYFPDPDDTLARLGARGLRLALNLHPADGVGRHEQAFEAMCGAMGLDPEATSGVPFDCTDPRFMGAYFAQLHHPEEKRGVDAWWLDWQQGKTSAIPGLDPLPWLNKLHWDDQVHRRPDHRPLDFSRWGGLGSGRYPIGFSGDTWSVWESLAYQPEFTATAANVGYGYWSHDIGGHYGPATTPELYTRWMQFGAHSPVLRTHGSKDPDQERRVWEFADPYRRVMIEALRRRYESVPYLYGEARRAGDRGLSLVRPMYHEHPNAEAAYEATGQYHLGDAMVVAPVVCPVRDTDAMAPVRVWLPQGTWFDTAHGDMVRVAARAGRWLERSYLLEEIPVFVPAGAVVPGQGDVRRLDAPCYRDLVVTAYPGGDGRHELYEDDGVTMGYQRGESALVPLVHRTTPKVRSVTVGKARGGYRGWDRRRTLEVRFVGEPPPQRVRMGSRAIPWSAHPGDRRWWYDASAATVVVRLGSADVRAGVVVRLDRHRDAEAMARRLDGLTGLTRRLDRIAELVGVASPHMVLHPEERLAVDLAQTANRIGRSPDLLDGELRRLRRQLRRLDGVLEEFQEVWKTAFVTSFSDPRESSIALLAQARGMLATTLDQYT